MWFKYVIVSLVLVGVLGQIIPPPDSIETTEYPMEETTDEPTEGTTTEPIEEITPVLPEETTIEPTEETTTEPTEETTEDPTEEIALEAPTVTIEQGTVQGTVSDDGNYFEFHGIPYADSTSGTHRFQAPSPPPSFRDTFVANRKGIKCVRATANGFEGTEDCLVANIYTPTVNATRYLPVMVWIKGTEFDKIYEHELSFRNFMEKDVVIVDLNYRESILGFLCLGTATAPGNAGLKDIVAGLQWVRQNILQFGGNPEDVTLFGHGSGAAAVDLVTLSPTSEGLVHKAIAQSGSALAPWAVTRDNLAYAVQVAEALGHVVTSTQQLSEVFTRTSVTALMATINELDLTDNSLAFSPCIERNLEGVEPFLTKTPYQIISEGDFVQIPFIMGFVDNEGTIRAREAVEDDWLERMENSFSDFLQPDLEFESDSERAEVAEEIKAFYFRGETISMQNVKDYITYQGDTIMLVSTIREVRLRAEISTAPLYLYQFSYKGVLGAPFQGPIVVNTAAHSEELAYLFYDTPSQEIPLIDLTVGDILVDRWTSFAANGVPESEISQVPWAPFTIETYSYLRFLDDEELNEGPVATLEIELENPHPETIMFWNDIYEEHFLDAESTWTISDRNEEDEDDVAEENGSGDAEGEDSDVVDETDFEPEDSPNSASIAIAYTFTTLVLFAILNNFHSNTMLC
ncbi:venom carboxylesterase-6 [Manduca sexta]|uniref:venom carboxylesterase-6 n=1 Tax=Manduca sexta TaxID=7130 RepID=UPI00189053B4|nr:venom carboxylesterase-6 [Manduca sexta]